MQTRKVKLDFSKLYSYIPYQKRYRPAERNLLDGYFEVERLISSRKIDRETEYMVNWENYFAYSCTWEPEQNLPNNIIHEFNFPSSPQPGIAVTSHDFTSACHSRLSQRTANHFYISFHHDIFRFLFGGKGIVSKGRDTLYTRFDFETFDLPQNWHKLVYTEKGEGRQIVFPIALHPVLRWSRKHFVFDCEGSLKEAPIMPIELLKVHRQILKQLR
ncbi:CDY [Mytilus coruscus]|uniref:CDY n=1 Tax=Mytilus coruscus TaxID=42192 RepID=A0A6J8DGE2_MYTCO|nr:CDY [Mytilus coruscus]